MAARLPGTEVIRIRPGDLGEPPAGINPLEPAPGPDGARFPLQAHADLVRALFLAAFEADEPFPQVLAAALTRCYEQAGWDLVTGEPAAPGLQPGYPALEDLQAAAMQVVERDRVRPGGHRQRPRVRHGPDRSSLRLGTTGRFLRRRPPAGLRPRCWTRNVVLEIEDAGDDRDKAFLMGAVLIRLAEHLRLRQRAEGPAAAAAAAPDRGRGSPPAAAPAPRPAGGGAAAHAVEMFAGLLAEIRAYGEGLIIAEQIPAKLIPDVIKNTAVKIVHRLPAADDRAGGRRHHEPHRRTSPPTWSPSPPARPRCSPTGWTTRCWPGCPTAPARETASPAAGRLRRAADHPRAAPPAGPTAGAAPCTLRQIRAAQRAAVSDPRITLWAELSVLAHLTGWLMPMPGPAFAAALAAMDARLRDCALSHAVDAAVAARIPAISARVSGPALAAHVTAAMRAALDDGPLAVRPARTAVARPALPVGAGPGQPASLPPPRPRRRAASAHRRMGSAPTARPSPAPPAPASSRPSQRWYDADQRDQQASPRRRATAPARPPPSSRPSAPAPPTTTGTSGSPTPWPPSATAAGPWTTCGPPAPGPDDEADSAWSTSTQRTRDGNHGCRPLAGLTPRHRERRSTMAGLAPSTYGGSPVLRPAIQAVTQQADQVIADFIGARVLPPLGVAVGGRRGGVGVRDEDDGIPAWLVDVVVQVGIAEPGRGLGEDP